MLVSSTCIVQVWPIEVIKKEHVGLTHFDQRNRIDTISHDSKSINYVKQHNKILIMLRCIGDQLLQIGLRLKQLSTV